MKSCLGCGLVLQDKDPLQEGYTPKIENDYCMRCFKIRNYGAKITSPKELDNENILNKINEKSQFVIFLIDFLNIYEEVINTFKKIMKPKMLVITKADLIPKNLKKDNLIKRIKEIYQIEEAVILTSSKTKENINVLKDIINTQKEVFICGFTNTGKSSLINTLASTQITVSKNANTTLDFIKIKLDEAFMYDTPGFMARNFLDSWVPQKIIRPIAYQLLNKYYLQVLDYKISSDVDNNFTFIINNDIAINKRRIKEDKLFVKVRVPENSDLIIKGLGFILIKKKCELHLAIPENLIEVRPSLVGGIHE